MADDPGRDVYDLLNEVWRREVEGEELARLPDDLAERLREYMGSIKHYLKVSDRETLSAELREAAANTIMRLLEEVFELRLRKIIRLALRNEVPENLYGFELRFCHDLIKLIQDYRDSVRAVATAAAYQDWEQIRSRYEVVCFLKDVSQIVGPNLEVYGPFKAGDLATLPLECARNLQLSNIVRIIKVLEPRL